MFIRIPSHDGASHGHSVPRVRFARMSVILALMLSCHLLTAASTSTAFGGQDETTQSTQSETDAGEKQKVLKRSEGEPANSAQVENLDQPPPLIPRLVRADAMFGEPYGVARLTIPIASDSKWRPDQPITVRAANERLLFPCHHVQSIGEGDELVIHFLFRGTDPLVVDVVSTSCVLAEKHTISVVTDDFEHRTRLGDWLTHYTNQLVDGPSEELSDVGHDVVAILGRQLGLRTPQADNSNGEQSSALEKQFERTVGMLLGFESVRLAMMKDTSAVMTDDGPAVSGLPSPFQMRAVPIPHMAPGSAKIERMASYVPPEYFYLRCESLKNYLWMRNLVMGWGGSLDQMVATPVVEYRIRERIERQLCLDPSLAMELDLDASLEDFAIVGGDTYFADGAAVGVLLLAKHPARIAAILSEMRRAVAATGGARHRTWTINGKSISIYETADNAVRSFHAVSGNCHLVTNSSMLVQRFLHCEKGQNLATLPEFSYARSNFPLTRELTSFLYLSDPFFRSLTSPATRIEASRRQRAAAELRQLKLARLIFAAQGLEGNGSIANLIQHRLLRPEFAKRADGAFPDFNQDGQMVDSLRGSLGTFLPIADIAPTKATYLEVNAYAEFTVNYRRQWAAMDPVAVALHRHSGEDSRNEQVDLEIAIAPYARDAYEFLAQRLAPPSNRRVKAPEADVLTLTTQLQGGTNYDVCVGLRDAFVPFRIENGTLIREGDFTDRTFADWQSYAAVTPASISGLQLLGEFTKALQSREIEPPPEKRGWAPNSWDVLDNVIHYRRYALRTSLRLIHDASTYAKIRSNGKWTAMAPNAALRNEVTNDLFIEQTVAPAQIRFHLADMSQSKVGPYLQAVSWEAGRRLSGENAAWLNHFAATTRLDLAETRDQVEELLGGEIRCPLGGTYEYLREGDLTQLASTAWGCLSRFDETAVPMNYRLPFLAWLRGLKLNFDLSATTLTSRVELHVDPTVNVKISPAVDRTQFRISPDAIDDTVEVIEREQLFKRGRLYERLVVSYGQLRLALDRIDPSGAWTIYLSVPSQSPRDDNDWKRLRSAAAKFQFVTTDHKYDVITNASGFAETHSRLKECIASLTPEDAD